MKLQMFALFYGGISIVYGLYKALFIFLHLHFAIAFPHEPFLKSFGFFMYLMFSFFVARAYFKHLRYAFALMLFSLCWTSSTVWLWVYLHMIV
ncbi:hypothetical protein [Ectobacillus panaciterrae]|uniref:hypothetical protein n=1 Tax=Ectobacillus panaciterrae TaxID=363872 RepID=UPI00048F250F|nr:hypothetical protein [Ectobacillus panaciterrae]